MSCATGLNRFAGITLGVANPKVGLFGSLGFVVRDGSVRPPTGKPLNLAGQAAVWLKSPAFSASVGTRAVLVVPEICLFHSSEKKKKALSFLIGPPMV